MNLNSLSFFKSSNENNNIQSNQGILQAKTPNASSAVSQSGNAGLDMLRAMSQGDTFQGEVVSVKDNQVLLRLAGGNSLTATLSGDFDVTPGKVQTFVIENNQGQTISIKPMTAGTQEIAMADKALESAGLSFSERNFEMVKELVRQNMPIDKNTLTSMARTIGKFPDTDIETLVKMTKLDIPVSSENIAQFKAYQSYESSIWHDTAALGEGFVNMLANSGSEGVETFGQVLENLFMYDEGKLLSGTLEKETLEDMLRSFEVPANPQEASGAVLEHKSFVNGELANAFQNIKEALSNPEATFKEVLVTIKENMALLEDADKAKLMENKAVKHLVRQGFRENLSFPLEEGFDKENVQKFFAKSENILKNLEDTLRKNPETRQLVQNSENIRQNIDFMNDINRNMAYFQMPINFSQGQGNGELYVFADKRKIMAKGDQLSALLHLDMENLGPVDVFVRLNGKNVSTSFTLATEELLDFVYSRIDLLNERLEQLGYNTTVEMKIKSTEKPLDFVEDFLESDSKPVEINQYLFDVKA